MPSTETHIYHRADGAELALDVVRPDGATPDAPAVIFFHGGAWRIGSREQFLPQCHVLAAGGTVGITASYRLAVEGSSTSPVDCAEDAATAVHWVRENASELGVDPARIGAGGGSAGGQLSAAVASMGIELAALVLFNPALGPDGTPRLKFMGDASPDWQVTEHFPPALVLHGTADQLVPIDNSRRFSERMKALGRRCELVEYEGMPHAFFNHPAPGGRYDETVAEMQRFLGSLDLLPGR